jgi:DNA-binding HxlR family transcriptional regulator
MLKKALSGNQARSTRPNPLADCPLHAAFVAVGGKWKLTILYWLGRQPHQFGQLKRRVAPISHKVLVEQLRELESHGLVSRNVVGDVPAPVLYRLTEYGDTLRPLIEAVRIWGERHLQRRRTVPAVEYDLACTAPLMRTQHLTHCSED